MKKFIISVFNLSKNNFKTIILFTIIYATLSYALIDLCIRTTIVISLNACNITYLGDNTIFIFLSNPVTWLLLIPCVFICSYLNLIFMSSFNYIVYNSKNNRKVSLSETIIAGIKESLKAFKFKNSLIIAYILCLVPFVNTIEITAQNFSVGIPGFIFDAIVANKLYLTLFLILLIILIIININLHLAIPSFLNKDYNFKEACKESLMLMKNNKLRFIGYSFSLFLLIIVCAFLVLLVTYFGFELIYYLLKIKLIKTIRLILICLIILIFAVFIRAGDTLAYFYFYFLRIEEEKLDNTLTIKTYDSKPFISILCVLISLVLLIISLNWVTNSQISNTRKLIPEIAAHRGDSIRAPENSMPAFDLAIKEGISTWVELDVHQTKDGVIIVSHDDYLGRIGIDKYVHESTYEELIKYDSGAWFSDEYKGLHLCTLKEALELMKNKVSVQIEIKPTEYDNHIEESILEIIKEVNSSLPNIVLSLSDKPLKRIKELDPNFPTIYCTIIASEGIENIEYADYFSIEESSITKSLVDYIHQKNKRCFVWTINKEDNVQYLVDCGVDVILTDDPIMMEKALMNCDYTDYIENAFDYFVSDIYNTVLILIDTITN